MGSGGQDVGGGNLARFGSERREFSQAGDLGILHGEHLGHVGEGG